MKTGRPPAAASVSGHSLPLKADAALLQREARPMGVGPVGPRRLHHLPKRARARDDARQ